MKYAYFNPNDGRILQWLDIDARNYVLPDASLLHECTDAEWERQYSGVDQMLKDGAIVDYVAVVQPVPLADVKAAALAAIDSAAGAARARYITIAPGQEATYLLKAQQAASFKAGGYAGTVPGLVQAEVDATGATAQQAADAILAQQDAWEAKAAQIESARRRGKVAVGAAADAGAIEAAEAAAIAELGGL